MAFVSGPLNRLTLAAVVLLAAGCAAGDDGTDDPAPPAPSPVVSTAAPSPAPAAPTGKPTEPKLRKELLAMLAADQKDRLGEGQVGAGSDQARTERLREIVARHGWPTRTMVGRDGATAAWAITQHSDLDPEFQQEMLELLRQAAAVGEASMGDVAYLTDRVAVGAGRPQTYGTQMGCGADGKPQLAPLAEPDRVDQLRAEAGLPTLKKYLAELERVCAQPP